MRTPSTPPTLARWRFAVAIWLFAWVLLVIVVFGSGLGALFAAATAYGLGRYGGPRDWNS